MMMVSYLPRRHRIIAQDSIIALIRVQSRFDSTAAWQTTIEAQLEER